VNSTAGEEKEFSLDIPENHSFKQIAGKKVDFKVNVNSVQSVELPEINDQFAKDLGNFNSLEELKENIGKGLLVEKEQAESQRIRNEVLEKISEVSNFEVPEVLVEREQEAMLEGLKHEISDKLKIEFKDYLDKIKKTEQEISDSFKKESEKKVRAFLILRKIGEKEKIEISEEEVRDRTNEILKQINKPEKDIDFHRLKDYSREVIRNERIFKILEELTIK